jgi:hypothetical protein
MYSQINRFAPAGLKRIYIKATLVTMIVCANSFKNYLLVEDMADKSL